MVKRKSVGPFAPSFRATLSIDSAGVARGVRVGVLVRRAVGVRVGLAVRVRVRAELKLRATYDGGAEAPRYVQSYLPPNR